MSINPSTPCDIQPNALTTLERVYQALELDILDESTLPANIDTKLCDLINAYSDFAERITGRQFRLQEYTEYYHGSEDTLLSLNHYPIVNVAEVIIDDEIIDSSEYRIEGTQKRTLYRRDGWPKMYNTAGMSFYPDSERLEIKITYTAGYVLPNDANPPLKPRTLPWDLERAILNLIAIDRARAGTSKGLKTFKISDVTWDFNIAGTTPQALKQISPADYATISRYRAYYL